MTNHQITNTEQRDVTQLIDVTSAKLDELEKYYDSWSETYENDLTSMGYKAPQTAAEAIEKLGVDHSQPILDAGCGVGLTGLYLSELGFTSIVGADYSTKSLEKSKERGCYAELLRVDLNKPLDLPLSTVQNE